MTRLLFIVIAHAHFALAKWHGDRAAGMLAEYEGRAVGPPRGRLAGVVVGCGLMLAADPAVMVCGLLVALFCAASLPVRRRT